VTAEEGVLENIRELQVPLVVTAANDTELEAEAVGDVVIAESGSPLSLTGVLLVPGLDPNLISAGQLAKQGFRVLGF